MLFSIAMRPLSFCTVLHCSYILGPIIKWLGSLESCGSVVLRGITVSSAETALQRQEYSFYFSRIYHLFFFFFKQIWLYMLPLANCTSRRAFIAAGDFNNSNLNLYSSSSINMSPAWPKGTESWTRYIFFFTKLLLNDCGFI